MTEQSIATIEQRLTDAMQLAGVNSRHIADATGLKYNTVLAWTKYRRRMTDQYKPRIVPILLWLEANLASGALPNELVTRQDIVDAMRIAVKASGQIDNGAAQS